eukprot:366462-Chlamydomonas_euryale.AAC.17
MLVAGDGRGLTVLFAFRSSRSSVARASPVTGHLPVSLTYLFTRPFSNTCPDLMETTGCSGTLPEMEQNIATADGCPCCPDNSRRV